MELCKGKISVIMPAYNESGHIYENIFETHRVMTRSGCRFEIIVVDDGSHDPTYHESMKASDTLRDVKVVHYLFNNGKGNALREGFDHASGDYVVFLDSDLDLHPSQLNTLFRVMRDAKASVVIGSKHHPDSELEYPAVRKLISRVYAFFLKVLFNLPLRDTQTGLKVYRYEVLKKVFPKILSKRYAYDLELLVNANRLGFKVVEAPVVLTFRRPRKWGRIGLNDLYLALGVVGVARATGSVLATIGRLRSRKETIAALVVVLLSLAVAADQTLFLKKNIYEKYRSDKAAYMYFKLFYGHFYGRSYKEVGKFLLKDAPLKENGVYRSALVYTIPEDSRIGRSLPLFNTINWYTQNRIMVFYDFKGRSTELYGTRQRLKAYLERLFTENPGLDVVYFADFVDKDNNFAYFSVAHPDIQPYRIVDDDGITAFDCMLFRFDRSSWQGLL